MYWDGLVRMGWGMKQLTLATVGFERYAKPTRRAAFLAEMERIVPWLALCGLIVPFYPKPGNGRPPVGVERMLRIYFLQQWFNLSDPAVEETLYDSRAMRDFVGIDLGREPVPDETTVCRFRHLLEEHDLGRQLIDAAVATPANVADSTVLPDLLHGNETRVWGDQAYRGQRAEIRQHAPKARDFTNRRYRHRGVVDEVERAKNRTKSKVRARVEHSIGVIKRVLGFAKVRYRGLKKNTHRLVVTCALANLFMARPHLLRCQPA